MTNSQSQTRKIPAILMQTAKIAETAKAQNVKEGYCPICDNVLRPSSANGVKVLTCLTHSIVMPVRD